MVDRRPKLVHDLRCLQLAGTYCVVDCILAIGIDFVDLQSVFDEHLNHFGVSRFGCVIQRRLFELVSLVHINPVPHEQLDHFDNLAFVLSLAGCEYQVLLEVH